MFICGRRSTGHQNEDKNGSNSTPKRSKRSSNKNPYAGRGLDKFAALLADLDKKKQKIYNEKGAEDISFIRFAYSEDQVKPIVVRVKNKNMNNNFLKHPIISTATTSSTSVASDKSRDEKGEKAKPREELVKRRQRWNGSFMLHNSLPVIIVLIMLFLVIYGRSFAILCTTMVLYMLPNNTIEGISPSPSSLSRMKPKRNVSEKSILQSENRCECY